MDRIIAYIDKKPKGNHPHDEHDEVEREGVKLVFERWHEEQGEEYGEASNGDRIYDSTVTGATSIVEVMEIMAQQSSDDGGRDELHEPKEHGSDS